MDLVEREGRALVLAVNKWDLVAQAGAAGKLRRDADHWVPQVKGAPIVAHIQEYYDYAGVAKYMASHGIVDGERENLHDDPIITLNMFMTDPNSIRWAQRVKAGKATIDGVSLANKAKNLEWGRKIVEMRAANTVAAIKKAIADRRK